MNERIKQIAKQVEACYIPRYDMWQMDTETMEKFAEMIIEDCAKKLVQDNMSNPAYAQAMNEYYEQKWAHRFD
jgi:hypothetical protein